MRMHTFVGKMSLEGLTQMDNHINDFLKRTKIEPVHIKQSFGAERHHGSNEEPVLLITVWYHEVDDDL